MLFIDEDQIREEMKDFINEDDEVEEEGDDDDDEGGGEKRKHESEEEDDQLEDEDYDLIEENLGIKVKRVWNVLYALRSSNNQGNIVF